LLAIRRFLAVSARASVKPPLNSAPRWIPISGAREVG